MSGDGRGRLGKLLSTRGRKAAAAVAGAFALSIAGALGAWSFESAKDSAGALLDTSAPITVHVAEPGTYTAAWPGGETWVFPNEGPGPEALSAEHLAAAQRLSWEWAPANGGVPGSPQVIRLAVRGRTTDEVTITRLAARLVSRGPAVRGWFLGSAPGCGEGEIRVAEIDLDTASPAVRYYESPLTGERDALELTVTRADEEQIELVVRTLEGAVEWELELFYSGIEGNGSVVVDDDGRPFRVTSVSDSIAFGVGDGAAVRTPGLDGVGRQTVC